MSRFLTQFYYIQPKTKSTYFSDSVNSVLNMKTFLDKNNVHKKTRYMLCIVLYTLNIIWRKAFFGMLDVFVKQNKGISRLKNP